MKSALSVFLINSRSLYILIILIGFVTAILDSGIMVIIGKMIAEKNYLANNKNRSLLFIILIGLGFLVNYLFNAYLTRITTANFYKIELNFIQRIKNASFGNISKIKNEQIYAAIGNIATLATIPNRITSLFNSVLTIIACVAYLFWSSYIYGLMILGLLVLIIASNLIITNLLLKYYEKLRKLRIENYKYIGDLLNGFKDLKMSSKKNETLFTEFISKNNNSSKVIDIKLKLRIFSSSLVSSYAWYLLLGVALFVLPQLAITSFSNTSIFIVILFNIIAPTNYIIQSFSFYSNLKTATNELNAIYSQLGQNETNGQQLSVLPEFTSITFSEICFDYFSDKDAKSFSIGPVNLQINKGEVVFIVGGNGSGKSTFLYLLTGLFRPASGTIYYNDIDINDENLLAYRNTMATVFFEGFLLSNNYEEFQLNDENEDFCSYLRMMKLYDAKPTNALFENKEHLSKGQQKRLTLILALLMNKKILVLDEWAAEQDPHFKEYFYKSIIPFLREKGITIISITHDDKYLSYADKVIKFRDGNIIYDYDTTEIILNKN